MKLLELALLAIEIFTRKNKKCAIKTKSIRKWLQRAQKVMRRVNFKCLEEKSRKQFRNNFKRRIDCENEDENGECLDPV